MEIGTEDLKTEASTCPAVAPDVLAIFERLNQAGVQYCLLRGAHELLCETGYLEIDLLVPSAELAGFSDIVTQLGFVELPSWGHAPHRFYVAYFEDRGDWIKLDVVYALRYGLPIRRFAVNLVRACMESRVDSLIPRLSAPNELVTILLHCLLDKGRFKPAHRDRLTELWSEIAVDEDSLQESETLVRRHLSPAITWQEVKLALSGTDCKALLARRRNLRSQFFRRQPIGSSWRNLSARIVRKLRPLIFLVRRRGFAVALLAPDGGGKSTLARSLSADRMLKARQVYMGGNLAARNVGLPTTRWLHQAVKSRNGKSASMGPVTIILRALNFINKLLEQWLRTAVANLHLWCGRVVIFDRYVYDSWVNRKKNTLPKRLRRLLFEAALPKPRLVLFLDAPGEVLFRRKGEHTPDWLEQQRQSYLKLSDRIPNMKILDASKDAESVRHQAIKLILAQRKLD